MVKKAHGMLAFFACVKECKDWVAILQLYKTLGRPYLEYCVQFWSSQYRKDEMPLGRVHRRFTRMLRRQKHLNCKKK